MGTVAATSRRFTETTAGAKIDSIKRSFAKPAWAVCGAARWTSRGAPSCAWCGAGPVVNAPARLAQPVVLAIVVLLSARRCPVTATVRVGFFAATAEPPMHHRKQTANQRLSSPVPQLRPADAGHPKLDAHTPDLHSVHASSAIAKVSSVRLDGPIWLVVSSRLGSEARAS